MVLALLAGSRLRPGKAGRGLPLLVAALSVVLRSAETVPGSGQGGADWPVEPAGHPRGRASPRPGCGNLGASRGPVSPTTLPYHCGLGRRAGPARGVRGRRRYTAALVGRSGAVGLAAAPERSPGAARVRRALRGVR